jgi:hypothetical protein
MIPLEGIIRPFQSSDINLPRRSATSSGTASSGAVGVTIGGTASAGAQIQFIISQSSLVPNPVTVTYTLTAADSVQTAIMGIIAAINANSTLAAAGITATGVSGNLYQMVINQPATLNPQASMTGNVTASLTMMFNSGNVSLNIGRGKISVKTLHGSDHTSITSYVHKFPKEMSFADRLRNNIPSPLQQTGSLSDSLRAGLGGLA